MISGIYNKTAFILLSEEEDGTVWLHFDESGFLNNAIAENESAVEAVYRDLTQKTGSSFSTVTKTTLSKPDETYSFVYTPKDKNDSTVIFCTKVKHPLPDPRTLHSIKLQDFKDGKLQLDESVKTPLQRMLPMLEHRLLGTPVLPPLDDNHFHGKSFRVDFDCFIPEFIATTPIKGLDVSIRRPELRSGGYGRYTVRGDELIDRTQRKFGIGKQYTSKETKGFSKHQSITEFDVKAGTPAFSWGDTHNHIGICHFNILPNRFLMLEDNTVIRPYDGATREMLHNYINNKKQEGNVKIFSIPEYAEFQKKVRDLGSQRTNEVLARIQIDPDKTGAVVFADTIEARWLAIYTQEKIDQAIQARAKHCFEKGTLDQQQYTKLINSKTPVYWYFNNGMGEYSHVQLDEFKKQALDRYKNETARKTSFSKENYEFLLMIKDPIIIHEIINNHVLMSKLLMEYSFIAEYIIEEEYKHTQQPVVIDFKYQQFLGVSRSFVSLINSGVLVAKEQEENQTLLNAKITRKDFSHLDLTKVIFSGAILYYINFNHSTFTLSGSTAVESTFLGSNVHIKGHSQFENIAFEGATLYLDDPRLVEFRNCTFKNVKLVSNKKVAARFSKIDLDDKELVESILSILKPKQLLLFALDHYDGAKLDVYLNNFDYSTLSKSDLEDVITEMTRRPEVFAILFDKNPSLHQDDIIYKLLSKACYSVHKIDLSVVKKILASTSNFNINYHQPSSNLTLLQLALRENNHELVKLFLAASAKSANAPDIYRKDFEGKTPISLAEENGLTELLALLAPYRNSKHDDEQSRAQRNQQFHNLAENDDFAGILKFMQDNPTFDIANQVYQGSTALHFACMNKNVDLIQYLISKGQSVIKKEDERRFGRHMTPLLYIVRSCDVNALEGFFDALGAQSLPQNVLDEALLFSASTLPKHWEAKGVAFCAALLAHGANIQCKDDRGNSPLDYAQQLQAPNLIGLFEKAIEDSKNKRASPVVAQFDTTAPKAAEPLPNQDAGPKTTPAKKG